MADPAPTPAPLVNPLAQYSDPPARVEGAEAASEVLDLSGPPDADIGFTLVQNYGCAACHSIDGSVLTGPSWQGIYGSQEALTDGTSATVNDEYITESINDPGRQDRGGVHGRD